VVDPTLIFCGPLTNDQEVGLIYFLLLEDVPSSVTFVADELLTDAGLALPVWDHASFTNNVNSREEYKKPFSCVKFFIAQSFIVNKNILNRVAFAEMEYERFSGGMGTVN